jgi:hydroxyacylglutathione hydrolase
MEPFDRDPTVLYGAAEPVAPGVRRVTARNPSPMTFSGTRSYVVGGAREVAVIDPGPDDPAHLAALLAAVAGARVTAVLVTHTHRDHSALAPALAAETGAPLRAYGPHGAGMTEAQRAWAAAGLGGGEGADRSFRPDETLADGDVAAAPEGRRLVALRTPGHLSNHLAFALEDARVAFTGDAAMGWSTTLISPPEGDATAQARTLRRLRARGDRLLLPGHGHPLRDPDALLAWRIDHLGARRRQVAATLAEGPADAAEVARRAYAGLEPALMPAAARNALAHLLALAAEGLAEPLGALGADARFRLVAAPAPET